VYAAAAADKDDSRDGGVGVDWMGCYLNRGGRRGGRKTTATTTTKKTTEATAGRSPPGRLVRW
jgi:hypothetical protein